MTRDHNGTGIVTIKRRISVKRKSRIDTSLFEKRFFDVVYKRSIEHLRNENTIQTLPLFQFANFQSTSAKRKYPQSILMNLKLNLTKIYQLNLQLSTNSNLNISLFLTFFSTSQQSDDVISILTNHFRQVNTKFLLFVLSLGFLVSLLMTQIGFQ